MLDLTGKTITTYILHEVEAALQQGDPVAFTTNTDEAIDNDIKAWCRLTGHQLAETEPGATVTTYTVEKGAPSTERRHVAVVLSQAGLEEMLSPLGFALAAALSGQRVSLYIQGPAVRAVTPGFKAKLAGIMRPFSRFARNGLAAAGHIPPQDKLRQLHALGAEITLCGPSMHHFSVKRGDVIFEEVKVAEYLSFMEVMLEADVLIYS